MPGRRRSSTAAVSSPYNRERPHRALELKPPQPSSAARMPGDTIERRDLLGGLIHEYDATAA